MKTVITALAMLCLAGPSALQAQAWTSTSARVALIDAAAAQSAMLGQVYRQAGGTPFWFGSEQAARRRADLLQALAAAESHGLPAERYQAHADGAGKSAMDQDIALTRALASYLEDLSAGLLVPSEIDREIRRNPEAPSLDQLAEALATQPISAIVADFAPSRGEYQRLRAARKALLRTIADGGWGAQVPAGRYALEDAGPGVLALRQRLRALGYSSATETDQFDPDLDAVVRAFQADHGLAVDGVVGPITLGTLNRTPEERLGAVLVALERERWLPETRGPRHIVVNLTDFSAALVEDEATVFRTRAVVGKNRRTHRTPEFSDEMEYLVLNPTWHVPRSIATREYLPKLQKDPGAAGHLRLVNSAGEPVNRAAIDFTRYTAASFPYALKQPPGTKNALGRVKFMFPNQYNIYLHDTPQRALFAQHTRTFSHGCIRLADPLVLAEVLLSAQRDDASSFIDGVLNRGREAYVHLDTHVPVHLIYRTAFFEEGGRLRFRPDIYGRDARILEALFEAGVTPVRPES